MGEDHACLGVGCKCQQVNGRLKEPRHKKDIKHSKNRSRAQELTIAKRFQASGIDNARRVPASGAFASLPGDVEAGRLFLTEAKLTRTGRITITPEWLSKIIQQARDTQHEHWALHAWVATGDSRYSKLTVIDEDFFFELVTSWNNSKSGV